MMEMIDNSMLLTFMYNYRLGLGSLQTDFYNDAEDSDWLWWIIFLFETVMMQIVFLNLLIAIMGDTFDRVQSNRVESKLREICEIIS